MNIGAPGPVHSGTGDSKSVNFLANSANFANAASSAAFQRLINRTIATRMIAPPIAISVL